MSSSAGGGAPSARTARWKRRSENPGPHRLRARSRLARALLDAGQADEARALAEAVLARGRESNLRSAQTRALHVLSRLAEQTGEHDRAVALEQEAVHLVQAGAAPLDGVLSIHHLGRLTGRADLLEEAAARVRARLADLRDPELRRGYLAQRRVQAILADAGPAAAGQPRPEKPDP